MTDYQVEVLKGLIKLIIVSGLETRLGYNLESLATDESCEWWMRYPMILKMETEMSSIIGDVYKLGIDKTEYGFGEIKMMIPKPTSNKKYLSPITVNIFE